MFDPDVTGTVLYAITKDLTRLADYIMQPNDDTNEEMRRHTLSVMQTGRDMLDDLIENIDGYDYGDEVEAADR